MSGINTLVDTLLHQVLGKRVDTAPPRELNQPVTPISPADALRAVHSDSRLDPRGQAVTDAKALAGGRQHTPAAPTADERQLPASTRTTFSPAARSIADVLMRFPLPPDHTAIIKPSTPLMASAAALPNTPTALATAIASAASGAGQSSANLSTGVTPSAIATAAPLASVSGQAATAVTQIAQQLQASVRDSGLFYESHLNRWFKGEMPREQLMREPQNARPLQFSPATPAVQRDALQPIRENMAPELRELSATHNTREPLTTALKEAMQDNLQGIVRQQLDVMVSSVLRWEGDVWAGLFMALVIQLPKGWQEHSEDDNDRQRQDEQQEWRTEMTLEVARLGQVRVQLSMTASGSLDLRLIAENDEVGSRLQRGQDQLQQRLTSLGLDTVRLRIDVDDVS